MAKQPDLQHPWPNWANRHHWDRFPRPTIGNEDEPSMARPEFAKEADINVIVGRLLAGQPVPMAQTRYGEVDYTVDLQGAYAMADSLVETYNKLPEQVRADMTRTEFVSRLLDGEQLEAFTDPQHQEPKPVAQTQQAEKTPPSGE